MICLDVTGMTTGPNYKLRTWQANYLKEKFRSYIIDARWPLKSGTVEARHESTTYQKVGEIKRH